MVLESPLAHARIVLHEPVAATLVAAMVTAATARELAVEAGDLPIETVSLLLALLAAGGMLDDPGHAGADPQSAPPDPETWEFHDLLFHARTRRGRSDAPSGATYRLAGRMDPPPAVRPTPAGDRFPLSRPDLESLQRTDPPLSRVVERRRTIREYGDRPIRIEQLGEFLYRVARLRDEQEIDLPGPHGPIRMAMASRPYPSGGALYELEFYAAIASCEGLIPGLYYYEPRDHGLIRIAGRSGELDAMLEDGARSAGIPGDTVQVLLILSARIPRLSWKYESIAYALVLKHVGVVYEAMYLAATAMKLAPCALGCGDSDRFARISGADYYDESSVGEFLLGSRPDPDESASMVVASGNPPQTGPIELPPAG